MKRKIKEALPANKNVSSSGVPWGLRLYLGLGPHRLKNMGCRGDSGY